MEKNQTKILLADELSDYVKGYSNLLTPEIIDYLNSLIGLETSALNQENIKEDVMTRLNELELYRKIVIYNIYNRTLNILEKNVDKFDYQQHPQGLSIFSKDRTYIKYDVFNYWMHDSGISNIVLKQTIIDPEKRQEQIDRLHQELEEIKASKKSLSTFRRRLLCADKATRMKYMRALIKELENRSTLESDLKNVTDAQNYFINQLLGNDGLQVEEDFVERPAFTQSEIAMQSITLNTYPSEVDRESTKKFVKMYPHTKISKVVKYY